jgi:hypothetical protein
MDKPTAPPPRTITLLAANLSFAAAVLVGIGAGLATAGAVLIALDGQDSPGWFFVGAGAGASIAAWCVVPAYTLWESARGRAPHRS